MKLHADDNARSCAPYNVVILKINTDIKRNATTLRKILLKTFR